MPQNANSIPLDDEDILDLTVVAEPGKSSGAAGGPPPRKDGFSEDLDALLDSLTQDKGAPAAAPAAPLAAPIADQTPEDHDVDPDEQIAMPEMADIDSLLAELGALVPEEEATAPDGPEEGESAEGEPAAQEAPAAPISAFDAILAQAQAADAAKAAEEAARTAAPAQPAAPPRPSAPVDPFEAALAEAAAPAAPPAAVDPFEVALAEASAPVPPAAPTASMDPFEAALAGAASAPVDPFDAALDEAEEDPVRNEVEDDLDLNELDALLDDILATAPEMSPPATPAPKVSAPAPAAPAAPAPAPAPAPAAPVSGSEAPTTLVVPSKKLVVRRSVVQVQPAPAPVADAEALLVPEQALVPANDHSALLSRIQSLEEAVAALEKSARNAAVQEAPTPVAAPAEDLAARVEAEITALLAPGSPFMNAVVGAVLDAVTTRDEAAEHAARFRENMERMAAAAAAKVIREEIAAIMAEE